MAFLWGCTFPFGHVYNVTGEFQPDGSCAAVVDGAPLFGPNANPRTSLDDSGNIWCSPLTPNGSANVEGNGVLAMLAKREGKMLKPGRYAIDDYYPGWGKVHFVEFAVSDRRLDANLLGEFGNFSIKAVNGEFEIIELDTARWVGRFAFKGRLAWSM